MYSILFCQAFVYDCHGRDRHLRLFLLFVTCILSKGWGNLQANADTVKEESSKWFVLSITQREKAASRQGKYAQKKKTNREKKNRVGNGGWKYRKRHDKFPGCCKYATVNTTTLLLQKSASSFILVRSPQLRVETQNILGGRKGKLESMQNRHKPGYSLWLTEESSIMVSLLRHILW